MLRGGNVVDSAIATMYCNTVDNSQSMGIGGGFIMTLYLSNGTKIALVARETAPAAASKNMFRGDSNLTRYGNSSMHRYATNQNYDAPRAIGLRSSWLCSWDMGTKAKTWWQFTNLE